MATVENRKLHAFTLLILLSLIWGTSFILMKRGLEVFSADEVGSIRVTAAAIFLLPFALTRLTGLNTAHYFKLLASGLMGVFIPAFLFATAQTRLESSITGIMNSLTPICTLIIGVALYNQKFKAQSIIGIIIGLFGTVLLILSKAGGEVGSFNSYALLVIVACILYGMNLNFVKFKIPDLNALTITSVSVALLGPLGLAYLLGFTEFSSKLSGRPAWIALGYLVLLALMSTALATILFNKLVKLSSPIFTSSVTYIIPMVAVMWGLLDGEKLALGHFAGMAAIIGGVYLANRK